jgi:hypothetical protein
LAKEFHELGNLHPNLEFLFLGSIIEYSCWDIAIKPASFQKVGKKVKVKLSP